MVVQDVGPYRHSWSVVDRFCQESRREVWMDPMDLHDIPALQNNVQVVDMQI
jgi:hypothetical protein